MIADTPVLVGIFLLGVAVGMAFLGLCLAWDREPKPKRQRLELGSNHDRLDAEAASYIPRPRSSSRRNPGRF